MKWNKINDKRSTQFTFILMHVRCVNGFTLIVVFQKYALHADVLIWLITTHWDCIIEIPLQRTTFFINSPCHAITKTLFLTKLQSHYSQTRVHSLYAYRQVHILTIYADTTKLFENDDLQQNIAANTNSSTQHTLVHQTNRITQLAKKNTTRLNRSLLLWYAWFSKRQQVCCLRDSDLRDSAFLLSATNWVSQKLKSCLCDDNLMKLMITDDDLHDNEKNESHYVM